MSANGSHDLWQVRLDDGHVVAMSIDDISEAFDAGTLRSTTPVMPAGDNEWTTLGDAAGLTEEEEAAVSSAAPVAPVSSVASFAPAPSAPLSFAPVPSAPLSFAPAPSAPAPAEPAPYSIAPMAISMEETPLTSAVTMGSEISGENPFAPPARSGRAARVAGIVAMFVFLIGLGVSGGAYAARPDLVRGVFGKAPVVNLKAAAVAQPVAPAAVAPVAAIASPAVAPEPTPAPVQAAPASSPAGTSIDNLPNASSAKAAKGAKASPAAKPAPKAKAAGRKASSDPSKKGGDKFDPMNGAI